MGETFGRYRLDRVLGHGGMGVVHAARDTVLDREVALKIVAPHLAGDEEFRARFQHEAEVLARLESDRIVRIYDHGEHEGSLFIVTQLVEGGDLQRLVAEQGALAPALALEIVSQVLAGLQDAHAVGVIHRDIKPANVLLRQRQGEVEAFLCDFGIAATAGAGFTMTGGIAGSLPYMAPERHLGKDALPASDVYGVGCLLWHCLTGSAPYVGTDFEIATAHVEGPVPRLPGRDDFSRRLNAVLAKALAKDPRKRYASARAMLADLRPLATGAPGVLALPGGTAIRRPVVRRRRRWVAPVSAAVAVVAVVSGVVAVAALGNDPERRSASEIPVPATLTATVSVAGGKVLGNQTTLRPADVLSRQPDGDVVVVEPGAPVVEEPPPAQAEEPRGSQPAGPRPSAKAGAPAPAPEPAPAPKAAYRCWDGSTAVELSECGMPHGATGLHWVFRNGSGSGCRADTTSGTQVAVQACPFSVNGRTGEVRLAQYTSVQAAKSRYDAWYGKAGSTWWHGGVDWGWMWSGTFSGGYRSTRVHRAGPYIVTVVGPDRDFVASGWKHVSLRAPAAFRGVPL